MMMMWHTPCISYIWKSYCTLSLSLCRLLQEELTPCYVELSGATVYTQSFMWPTWPVSQALTRGINLCLAGLEIVRAQASFLPWTRTRSAGSARICLMRVFSRHQCNDYAAMIRHKTDVYSQQNWPKNSGLHSFQRFIQRFSQFYYTIHKGTHFQVWIYGLVKNCQVIQELRCERGSWVHDITMT